jgi:hypothetical protein
MPHVFPEASIQERSLVLRPFTGGDVEATLVGCSDELTQQQLPLPRRYWLAPWARGRGAATEATRAVGRWLLADQRFERMS